MIERIGLGVLGVILGYCGYALLKQAKFLKSQGEKRQFDLEGPGIALIAISGLMIYKAIL